MVGRILVLVLTLLSAAGAIEARPGGQARRLGMFLYDGAPPGFLEAFRDELRALGHVEGQNLRTEMRNAAGRNERLGALADELVRLKVDVILAMNTTAAQAAMKATTTIPIVMARAGDPVRSGLVSKLQSLPVRGPGDLPAAFQAATRARAEALFVLDDTTFTRHRIAYGPSLHAVYRRTAHYVDRILKGARPGDLPIEEPTEFDLVVNLRTARTLGLKIPPSVLLITTYVIE